jgi:hypothetical protein
MWDICGQGKIRVLWRYYYENTQGKVFWINLVLIKGYRMPVLGKFVSGLD